MVRAVGWAPAQGRGARSPRAGGSRTPRRASAGPSQPGKRQPGPGTSSSRERKRPSRLPGGAPWARVRDDREHSRARADRRAVSGRLKARLEPLDRRGALIQAATVGAGVAGIQAVPESAGSAAALMVVALATGVLLVRSSYPYWTDRRGCQLEGALLPSQQAPAERPSRSQRRLKRCVANITPASSSATRVPSESTVHSLIHFVDYAKIGLELRPVCGAWSDDITWTTLGHAMTCPACARLARVAKPERRSAACAVKTSVLPELAASVRPQLTQP